MNKIAPFILVIAFWGIFYIGNKYPGTGETIASIAVICLLMIILFKIKSYLIRKVLNKQ